MRTETGQDVIAAAVEILSEHAKGVVVSPEAIDWALSIAIANGVARKTQHGVIWASPTKWAAA